MGRTVFLFLKLRKNKNKKWTATVFTAEIAGQVIIEPFSSHKLWRLQSMPVGKCLGWDFMCVADSLSPLLGLQLTDTFGHQGSECLEPHSASWPFLCMPNIERWCGWACAGHTSAACKHGSLTGIWSSAAWSRVISRLKSEPLQGVAMFHVGSCDSMCGGICSAAFSTRVLVFVYRLS